MAWESGSDVEQRVCFVEKTVANWSGLKLQRGLGGQCAGFRCPADSETVLQIIQNSIVSTICPDDSRTVSDAFAIDIREEHGGLLFRPRKSRGSEEEIIRQQERLLRRGQDRCGARCHLYNVAAIAVPSVYQHAL